MARGVCKLVGFLLLVVGLLGFTHILDSLGAHVGPANATHNLVHLVSGVLALYFGFAGSLASSRLFCLFLGVVYLLLGIVGFAKGSLDIPTLKLMLGQADHVIHVVLGLAFLGGGALTKR